MRSNPLISIIVPTYNHGQYLIDCLDSIRQQTYSNLEIIVVDDASDEASVKLLRPYLKDKRISVISHKTNWGIEKLASSCNQAFEKSHGELVAILEGDDYWPKNALESHLLSFVDPNIVLSFGDWTMVNSKGYEIYTNQFSKLKKSSSLILSSKRILQLFLGLRFDISSQSVLMRRKALSSIGGFKVGDQYPFIDLPTYLHLALIGKFKYVPKNLGLYRRHSQSAWFKFASKSRSMGRSEICSYINTFVLSHSKSLGLKINWREVKRLQEQYLQIKQLLYPFSVLFNRYLNEISCIRPVISPLARLYSRLKNS